MPYMGRPQGAKGKRRGVRDIWENDRVVVEVDSDESDNQGAGLGGKRFASDPLQFTGTDLATTRSRKSYVYPSESSASSDSEGGETQAALREKQEALVQSALRRIRRAQEKGKTEVNLNPEELEALEKRRKRMQAAATAQRKSSGSSAGSGSERRHSSRTIAVPIGASIIADQSRPSSSQKSGKSKSQTRDEHSQSLPSGAPGVLIHGPDGITYAPLGYYPHEASDRTSPTRTRSATLQTSRGSGLTRPGGPLSGPASRYSSEGVPPAIGYGSSRHFSDPAARPNSSSSTSRRPLPDEHDWVPVSSSRRNSQQVDPFEYQVSNEVLPIPQQYRPSSSNSGRRSYAGPGVGQGMGEIQYSSVRRSLPAGYSIASKPSSSSMRRREYRDELGDSQSEDEDDESEDSEMGNGVQVSIGRSPAPEPEPEPEKPKRKPVGGKGKKKR